MTEPGQTDNYKLSDHVETIIDHAGIGVFDTVLADNGKMMILSDIVSNKMDGRDDDDDSSNIVLISSELSYAFVAIAVETSIKLHSNR